MILDAIRSLIGEVPEGYEVFEYIAAAGLLIFTLGSIFYGISLLIKRISDL